MYARFLEIQSNLNRKKIHRKNQGSNFYGGTFSKTENVRAQIQFRRKSQPKHHKRWFLLKNRLIHSPINSTNVIILIKWNQLSLSSIEINKPLAGSIQSVSKIRLKFRSQSSCIVHIPPFQRGGSKFWLPLWREGTWKIKKRGWKYGPGAGPAKRGALTLFVSNFFKVYHV